MNNPVSACYIFSVMSRVMSCMMGKVSSCPLLQQSLYHQLHHIPALSQALGLCGIAPNLATMGTLCLF